MKSRATLTMKTEVESTLNGCAESIPKIASSAL